MSYDSNLTRLPDPNTVPAGPGFMSVPLTNNAKGTKHNLNTGGVISVKFAGSYWTFSIQYPELTIAEAETIIPLLYSLSEGFETIYVQLPQYINPKTGAWDTSTAILRAEGAISIGSRSDTIQVTEWSTRGGTLSPGDMLKFTNSNKIYQVVSLIDSGTTKIIRLNTDIIEPDKIPAAGLEPNDIKFRVIMSGNLSTELTNKGTYTPFSVNFRENIR